MLKVLIAEDEEWIRKGIIKAIDWDGLNMQLVAEAANGKIALQLADEFEPDIILIDIRMPGMDGLETINNILSEAEQKPKIIIVSGYDNFEYAQKAISYGIFAYILKPVKKNELNNTLRKAKELILQEKDNKKKHESIQKKIDDTLSIVKEKMIGDIVEGKSSSAKKVGEDVISFSPFYQVLVAGACDFLHLKNANSSSYELLKQKITQKIEGVLPKSRECMVYEKSENCYIIIIGIKSVEDKIPNMAAANILKDFNTNGPCKLTIGIGQTVKGVNNIRHSFENAYKAYKEKLIMGGGITIGQRSDPVRNFIVNENTVKDLCLAVEVGNKVKIPEVINEIVSYMSSKNALTFDNVYRTLTRIANHLDYICEQYGFVWERFEPQDLLSIEGIDNFKDYLYGRLILTSDRILFERERDSKKAVEKAKAFIEINYMKSISLKQLAAYVYLNPNYLSEIFKKETGSNFLEFLLMKRIEKAKQLLKKPDISVNKVAEMVGYSNPRYFSSVFRRLTGSTPTEFRNVL